MQRLELKVPPLLLMLLFAAMIELLSIIFAPQKASTIAIIFGCLSILLGAVVCVTGFLTFKFHHATPDPRDPNKSTLIVRSGIYAFSRNPMYLGFVLILFGQVLYIETYYLMSLVILFIYYLTRFQINPEERILKQKFGLEYEQYLRDVRRWL